MTRTVFFALLLMFAAVPSTWARWSETKDAYAEIESFEIDIQVSADGTWQRTTQSSTRILTEEGRTRLGMRHLYYNPNLSKITVLEAKTIADAKEYPVPLDRIEDKAIANSGSSFDETRAVTVVFPRTEVGSRIFWRFHQKHKPSIPGQFAWEEVLGDLYPERNGIIRISSEIPLSLGVNDPTHAFQVNQTLGPEGKNLIEIKLAKTVHRVPVDEESAYLHPKHLPKILVSSIKNWKELAQAFVPSYEEVLAAPLPPMLEEIRSLAEKKKSDIDRLNVITSEIAARITYIAELKTINGRLIPRPLLDVAESRRGDCKDYSAATVAIARALGYKAHIALVKRSPSYREDPLEHIPHVNVFNHAIVHIELKKKSHWIDPTNFASFAQGVFPDIDGRPALIIAKETTDLKSIPANTAESGSEKYVFHRSLDEDGRQSITGFSEYSGLRAIPFTGMGIRYPRTMIDRSIIEYLADIRKLDGWKVKRPALKSRIVAPLRFSFSYEQEITHHSSAGMLAPIPGNIAYRAVVTAPEKRVSDIYLGSPTRIFRETYLHGVEMTGDQSLNCTITSPWLIASRIVLQQPDAIAALDTFEFKKSWINQNELKTEGYRRLRQDLLKCFDSAWVIYRKKGEPARVLAAQKPPDTVPSSSYSDLLWSIIQTRWK